MTIMRPALFCPFPSSVNAHVAGVQQQSTDWAVTLGLVNGASGSDGLERAAYGWLAARVYPTTDFANLRLAADWITWLFLLDDRCDEDALGCNPGALQRTFDNLTAAMDEANNPDNDPFADALIDLTHRFRGRAREGSWARLRRSVLDYFEACVWEAHNRAAGRPPTIDTYRAMRPSTGAMMIVFDLADVTDDIEMSTDVRADAALQQLTSIACNVVCWANDIISVEKEIAHQDVHNLVLVLSRAEAVELNEAANRAAALLEAEVHEFLDVEQQMRGRGVPVDINVERYVSVLRSWMRGNIDWALGSGRYILKAG